MSIKWHFPSTGGGRKAGLNDSGIETFKDKPIRSLAREICQNSLDAAIKGKVDKLVGLKDEQGTINMFIYDEEKDNYKYYQELSLNKVILATVSIPEDKIIDITFFIKHTSY